MQYSDRSVRQTASRTRIALPMNPSLSSASKEYFAGPKRGRAMKTNIRLTTTHMHAVDTRERYAATTAKIK